MVADLLPRRAAAIVSESLRSFRAVVVQGARQVGKSTLVSQVAEAAGAPVVTFDNEATRVAAAADRDTFLAALGTPAIIDEFQRGGDELVLGVKQRLDADRSAGQYLLTGSTNFLAAPTFTESLAGRIDVVDLWPLSVGECTGGRDELVDRAFAGTDALLGHSGETPSRAEYLERVCLGGYPEVQAFAARARRRWFERYLETVLRREVQQAVDLRRFDSLVSMSRLLLSTTGSELVVSSLATQLGIDRSTAQAYEAWLEATFFVHRLPAWSRKAASRVVRRPKLHAVDTGLAAGVIGKSPTQLAAPTESSTGPLVESFAVNELAKQATWSETSVRLHHLRERDGTEIDVILESSDGRIVAVEVKASAVARPADAKGMMILRDRLDRVGDDFVGGIVFHTGRHRFPLGDRLVALPIADLWT